MDLIIALLALLVAASWIAAFGFARLNAALDRVHCVTFAAVASGGVLVVLAFVADGVSNRSLKIAALAIILLISGAALSHATGRAVVLRPHEEDDR